MLRFLDAGESHGKCLLGIIEGLPAGFSLNEEKINLNLMRRQGGYGRGERMKIEQDRVEILSGLIEGKTVGSPLGLMIKNKDWENWQDKKYPSLTIPRPGHADFAGAIKYGFEDVRKVSERASARQTAMRVAIGSVAQQFLEEFDLNIYSYVLRIGQVKARRITSFNPKIKAEINKSPVYCIDGIASIGMCREIDRAREKGDTLGGVFEMVITGVPVGLGSYAQWDRRLDAKLASAFMSIPGVKAVEIGEGIEASKKKGSAVHDEIFIQDKPKNNSSRYYRKTNRAGGIEGGITNGEDVMVRTYIKPIPTLINPLRSIDFATKKETKTIYQRSDICVVPAASVVGEVVAAWEIAVAFLEKFGGDSLIEIKENYKNYKELLREI
ncbi:MAG: chorismate synthase [Actinobacteria bacterium RBG_13_35_12]|jgi:chorismate synthase|nr:MAG: chorismate synthase [Actinobacteria bacterium RBG_13_35_12]